MVDVSACCCILQALQFHRLVGPTRSWGVDLGYVSRRLNVYKVVLMYVLKP